MSAFEHATIVFLCSLFWTCATTMQILNKHYWKHLSDYPVSAQIATPEKKCPLSCLVQNKSQHKY